MGSNILQIRQIKYAVLAYFPRFFTVLIGVYGVLIIPKWLIKVPGHIAILFTRFFELPNS